MEDSMNHVISTAITVIVVVILISISMLGVKIARDGFTRIQQKEITIEKASVDKFVDYQGSLTFDSVVNFISTYSVEYGYVLVDGSTVKKSENVENGYINKFYANGTIPTSAVSVGVPLDAYNLIRNNELYYVNNNTFRLYGLTKEGVQKDITEAAVCSFILIKKE